jgi:septal ring factor EnvC (AmiA/AmiB activator)
LKDFDFAQYLKVSAGRAIENLSGTVSAAVSTMAEKRDQNDDGDRHPEQKKQNRTHRKASSTRLIAVQIRMGKEPGIAK